MEIFNDAMLGKMGWRIIQNPNILCVKLLKGIYYMLCTKVLKGIYFPHSIFMEVKQGHKASWVWSSLLKGRVVLKKWCRWQVRSGHNIGTWINPWIPILLKVKISSQKSNRVAIHMVKDLMMPHTGGWNN